MGRGFAAFGLPASVWAGVAALALLVAFPGIDLAVSAWFYRPDDAFPLANLPLFIAVLKDVPDVIVGATVVTAVIGLAGALARRAWFGIRPRAALYLAASLAIGPGLLVNTLFKDHWGRARPHQIVEFGGAAHYSRAVLPADQCARNCSFPSGHAALGFWLVAVAFVVPARWRGPVMAGALAAGALLGAMRIAQGAHFLSDVVAAAILVVCVNIWLKRLILPPGHD